MMQRKPKSKFQPTQPTLRVDSQLAWRQGDNAVILPIVYEPAEPELPKSNPDAAIVTINWPLKVPSRKLKTSIISIEGLSSEEDRKEKLALLKQKVESAKERIIKTRTLRTKELRADARSNAEPVDGRQNSTRKSKYFATAVQLLLLSVIALVVFAWMCFR